MKRVLVWFFYILAVYCYFHNPVLSLTGGMGLIKFLYPLALLAFVKYYGTCTYLFHLYRKEFHIFIAILLFIVIRTIFGGDGSIIYPNVIFLIEAYFLPIVIVAVLRKKGFNKNKFISLLLLVSSLASIISTICIAVPSVGAYVRNSLLVYGSEDYLTENLFRGFGISDALTSSYGYIQGVCLAIGAYNIKDNKWYVLFFPFVVLSILLNARTGILLAIIGIFVSLLCRKQIKNLLIFVVAILAIIVFLPYFFTLIGLSDDSLLFVSSFFDELRTVTESRDITSSNTTYALFNSMIVWPDDISQWVFGRGIHLFRGKFRVNSDVGFINQLNYGGIVYVCILFSLFIKIISRMLKNKVDTFYVILFLVSAVLLNIKCDFFCNIGIFRFYMLLYFFFISNNFLATNKKI